MRSHTAGGGGGKPDLAIQPLPELPLPDGISTWTATTLDDLKRSVQLNKTDESSFAHDLFRTIDILGSRSQRAQGINTAITSVSRLRESVTYKLFLLTYERRGLGILKVGVKKLFVSHPQTKALVECDPLCVLDFYVGEESQRRGFGKQLFEHVLASEGVTRPETLAIDSPSPKFLSFLRKHYGLGVFTPQVNNFVVFHRFFDGTTVTERGRLRRMDGPAFAGDTGAAPVAAGNRGHLKGDPSVSPQQSSHHVALTVGRHSLGPLQPLPTTTTLGTTPVPTSTPYVPLATSAELPPPPHATGPAGSSGFAVAAPHSYRVDMVQPQLSTAPYLSFRDDVNTPRRSGALAPLPPCGAADVPAGSAAAVRVESGGPGRSQGLLRPSPSENQAGVAQRRLPQIPPEVALSGSLFSGHAPPPHRPYRQ